MSAETDDDDRKGLAWFPLLVSAAVAALLAIALITSGGDSSSGDSAAQPPPATAAAPTTTEGSVTTDDDDAAGAEATTAAAPADAVIPEEVQSDPVVQRLTRGRSLPFTAGPWRLEQWRDAVYGRLRPATRERAEKVAVDGGYGILIQ